MWADSGNQRWSEENLNNYMYCVCEYDRNVPYISSIAYVLWAIRYVLWENINLIIKFWKSNINHITKVGWFLTLTLVFEPLSKPLLKSSFMFSKHVLS